MSADNEATDPGVVPAPHDHDGDTSRLLIEIVREQVSESGKALRRMSLVVLFVLLGNTVLIAGLAGANLYINLGGFSSGTDGAPAAEATAVEMPSPRSAESLIDTGDAEPEDEPTFEPDPSGDAGSFDDTGSEEG